MASGHFCNPSKAVLIPGNTGISEHLGSFLWPPPGLRRIAQPPGDFRKHPCFSHLSSPFCAHADSLAQAAPSEGFFWKETHTPPPGLLKIVG